MKIAQASVVLTGAGGGLGAQIARRLLQEGARILLVDRDRNALLSLAHALSTDTTDRTKVDALVVDLTTQAGREAVLDAAAARSANVLINNAGIASFGPTTTIPAARIEAAVAVNVTAPIVLTSSMLPLLLAQPRAQIINIGSTLASIGVPGFAIYGATKAALRLFSESLRRELADTNVRVQYFAPRAIATAFNSPEVEAFNAETGTRADDASDIAARIVNLVRDETPEYHVGAVESIGVRLNGVLPRLLDGSFAKHRRALTKLQNASSSRPQQPQHENGVSS
ncbi:MAG: SDR family oxidoreductase [Chromatiales bacterium]|nr:SDR family oxidoreductase [Chromatiales bacterium]